MMRWLAMRRYKAAGERGAVAILVAVVLSGMMLALGAFVTDVGQWYAERAQLQNGADAAALAVAQTCIEGWCDTSIAAGSTAGRYANLNANDDVTQVDYICGRGPGLSPCPATSSCPSGKSGLYVTVHTSTLERSGSHLLPPMFGTLLLGEDYDGRTIQACAQASWEGASGGFGMAMTISLCAWMAATQDGTIFAPRPPYANWPSPYIPGYTGTPPAPGTPGGEQVLMFHGAGNDCAGQPSSGWQLPGGFGYLEEVDPKGGCTTTVHTDRTYNDQPGNSVSEPCADKLIAATATHSIIYIPVFDGFVGTGQGGLYHLAGFAAFVPTGGWLSGTTGGYRQASTITGHNYCRGDQRCVYGFFTQGLVPNATFGGSALNGACAYRLTG